MKGYDRNFYEEQHKAKQSAEEIVPFLVKLVNPKSVVDVGGGIGIWLKEFENERIKDILLIEGPWAEKDQILIESSKLKEVNFEEGKISLDRRFDLVVSLEVAEHLPKKSAENFVDSLTNLGDVILFSAAIPFQDGTNHLNEQYPSYWKELFSKRGFIPLNLIREKFWDNSKIDPHYLQNALIYVKNDKISKYPNLKKENRPFQVDIVHPKEYERFARVCNLIKRVVPRNILKILRIILKSENGVI